MRRLNKNQIRELRRMAKNDKHEFSRDGFTAELSRNGETIAIKGRGPEDYVVVPVPFLLDALRAVKCL